MIAAERVERAAEELWKLDVDCGAAGEYDRDRYVRRAITVLRHAGTPFTSPDGFDGCAKAPGGCARGYCRSFPACPGTACRAVC